MLLFNALFSLVVSIDFNSLLQCFLSSSLNTVIGKHILYLNIIEFKCYGKVLQILQIALKYFYISRLTVSVLKKVHQVHQV